MEAPLGTATVRTARADWATLAVPSKAQPHATGEGARLLGKNRGRCPNAERPPSRRDCQYGVKLQMWRTNKKCAAPDRRQRILFG